MAAQAGDPAEHRRQRWWSRRWGLTVHGDLDGLPFRGVQHGVAGPLVGVLQAREESPPAEVEPLDWRLLSNRSVETWAAAAELIQWYGTRWSIEVFFRIFKTGCRVEALQLSTLERLEPALALYLIIAWRIQYLTLLGRVTPEWPCDAVLDPDEWHAVYVAVHHQPPPSISPPLPTMLGWIARLGGHLGRKNDGPPGPQSLWSGFNALVTSPRECN